MDLEVPLVVIDVVIASVSPRQLILWVTTESLNLDLSNLSNGDSDCFGDAFTHNNLRVLGCQFDK